MVQGNQSLRKIKKDYYKVDSCVTPDGTWVLYEHEEYGDEVDAIAVNLTERFYTYTQESLEYTRCYLEDFELFTLAPS